MGCGKPINKVMKPPSSWLATGIRIDQDDRFRPFYFTDELQSRLESLLQKSKDDLLTPQEQPELTGLLELDRIFSFINAKLASESWQLIKSQDGLSTSEQNTCASTATPRNEQMPLHSP